MAKKMTSKGKKTASSKMLRDVRRLEAEGEANDRRSARQRKANRNPQGGTKNKKGK